MDNDQRKQQVSSPKITRPELCRSLIIRVSIVYSPSYVVFVYTTSSLLKKYAISIAAFSSESDP